MITNSTLKPYLDRCAAFDEQKHDTLAETSKMVFQEGRLNILSDFGTINLGIEDEALRQLGDRLGRHFWQASKRVVPADVYRQLHNQWPVHFDGLTNDLLAEMKGKFFVRGYGEDVRAFLSDQYAALDNRNLLEMAEQVLDGVNFQVVESGKYYSQNDGVGRDEMSLRIVVKNVQPPDEPGPFGLGVMIRNGETGGGASEVRPLIMRTTCMNSLVLNKGAEGEKLGLRLLHRGLVESKEVLLAAAVAEALPMAQEGLKKFLETKRTKIDLAAVIGKLGEDEGWGEEVRLTIAQGTEGHESLFGLINGITFAAHQTELSMTDRVAMESKAAELIYRPGSIRV